MKKTYQIIDDKTNIMLDFEANSLEEAEVISSEFDFEEELVSRMAKLSNITK